MFQRHPQMHFCTTEPHLPFMANLLLPHLPSPVQLPNYQLCRAVWNAAFSFSAVVSLRTNSALLPADVSYWNLHIATHVMCTWVIKMHSPPSCTISV